MSWPDVLIGKPLASDEARAEQIGAASGLPIFGLDALSSAAYGPGAALTLLLPLGAADAANNATSYVYDTESDLPPSSARMIIRRPALDPTVPIQS